MVAKKHWDVIVVGAGPAGAMTAMRLATLGVDVLLLDKATFPRNKACGGGLTPKAVRQLDFDIDPLVLHRADSLYLKGPGIPPTLLHSRNGASIWMVRRRDFDAYLVDRAREHGIIFHSGETLLHLYMGHMVHIQTNQGEYWARVVVGADGAESKVARLIGLRNERHHQHYMFALEVEVTVEQDVLNGVAFVDYCLPKGYAWVFPKGLVYNVGIGSSDPATFRHLRVHLARFTASLNLPIRGNIHPVGHYIPVWTYPKPLHRANVLLVGDAAGLADALWGEGISYAMASGQIAAWTIAAYLHGQVPDLSPYTKQILRTLAKDLNWLYRMMRLVHGLPKLIFPLLVRSARFQLIVAQIISGNFGHFPWHMLSSAKQPSQIIGTKNPHCSLMSSIARETEIG